MSEDDKVSMSQAEFAQAIETAVTKAKVDSLSAAFEDHEKQEHDFLKEIFDKLREVQQEVGQWPLHLTECSRKVEDEILEKIKDTYMTKKNAEIMEKDILNSVRSIKLWIVASVGGFTAAGLAIAWALKLFK